MSGSCRGCRAAATACRRRSSPRAWSPGCSRSSRRERPRRRFTIGIDDDVSGTSLAYDRVAGHRAARHGARGVLRAGRGRDGRREQEHDQDPRLRGEPATPRATSSMTRRSRARRPCRTCASGRSRSGRPTSCSSASFVGCHQFGLLEQVDVLGRAAPGATLLLNCRHAPDAVWDALSRPVQEQILAKRIDVYAIDAGADRPRGRPRRADQHRAADLLLRHLRRAAARRGDRPDQGGDRQDLRQARRRGGRAQPRGGRPGAGGAAPDRGARPGDGHARAAAARCPRTRRSSSAPSPRR